MCTVLRVISANVNGLRAAVRRGGLDWLAQQRPDVLTLQEVRCSTEQLHEALDASAFAGWHVAYDEPLAKGRSGCAVVSRQVPGTVRIGLGHKEFAGSGRWVEVDLDDVLDLPPAGAVAGPSPLTVVSAYVHTGQAATERQVTKERFLDAMSRRMAVLVREARHAVVTGDLNVAHRELDLRNWRGNKGKAGFLPSERAFFDRWLAKGWHDVQREIADDVDGPYSWWSWRGQAFDNDTGWRIDYQLATADLADRAVEAFSGRAASYAQRWSDHAAVVVDYDA
jgi:exodeoxyribonuclease-3